MKMNARYRLMRRGARGGIYYCVDAATRKRESLQTSDRVAAARIVAARNEADRKPALNLQIAKAYLAGTDGGAAVRT